ncbi:MAG: DUF2800 domain-containing protein [Micavibrio sp.]|nr:DUF2800 domain-containing protein [Micavibrio sp.]
MKKTETKLRLPASSAHIWAHCGGSAGRIRSARSPFESRDEARRGVVVHKIGANLLRKGCGDAQHVEKLDPIEYQIYEAEKEDIDTAAAFYAGHVLADFKAIRATDKGATLRVEERLTVEGKTFTIDGPPDAFIVSPAANFRNGVD